MLGRKRKKKRRSQIVIGLIGTIGSGKGTAASYLKKAYRFHVIGMGNIVREIAEKEKVEVTRESLGEVQDEYRKKFGSDYIARIAANKAKTGKWKRVVLDGVRTPDDAETAKKELHARFIMIDAPPEVRFKRMRERGRHGDARTWQEFWKAEKREWRKFNLHKTFSYARHRINNARSIEDLHKKMDKVMNRLGIGRR